MAFFILLLEQPPYEVDWDERNCNWPQIRELSWLKVDRNLGLFSLNPTFGLRHLDFRGLKVDKGGYLFSRLS